MKKKEEQQEKEIKQLEPQQDGAQKPDEQQRREARRKRRVRNQILAYVVVIALIAGLAVGIVIGVKQIMGSAKGMKAQEQEKQEQVEELFAEEESIPEPVVADTVPEEPPVPELTPEEKLDMIVDARIEVMPLEDKVAGLFIVTPESITGVETAVKAGDGTKEALTKYAVGGIVYSAKNMKDEEQFREMLDNTRLYASYPLFLAVEEEGGKFAPLAQAKLAEATDDAAAIAAKNDVYVAYEAGAAIGESLAAYGLNLDLAPVADLNSVEDSVLGNRSFGSDAEAVSPYVVSMLHGIQSKNVASCLKHFPGMGSTSQDTAKGLAGTERTAEDFRANEFVVFRDAIGEGADMVMVSNMSAPSLAGDNTPCSMSSAIVTDILRGELNFRGVIITEPMDRKAVSEYYGADEAAVRALRAGCDMILMPEDFEKAYNGVLEAVKNGEIAEARVDDALRRIYRIKDADKLEE